MPPPPTPHPTPFHHHPHHMTADTGVFRSSTGLFCRKALIPGNPLYEAVYAKLTHITQPPRRSEDEVGWRWGWGWGVRFADARAQNVAHPGRPSLNIWRVHERKHSEDRSRDPSVSLAKTRSHFPWCRRRCIIHSSSESSSCLSLCMACVGKEHHLLLPQTKRGYVK